MSLDRDLARWESGTVTYDELLRDHSEADLGGLLSLHERMSAMGTEPVPLDEVALQRFLGALPDRARPRRRGRSLLLSVAAVLLTAAMAVAMPGVRHGVTAITHSVGRLLGIESGSTTTPAPPGTTPATLGGGAGDHQGASGGATGPSDHDAADHEGGGTHGSEGGVSGDGDGDGTGVGDGTGGGGQDQQGDEGSGSGGDQGGAGSGSDDSSSGDGSGSDDSSSGDGSGSDDSSSGDSAVSGDDAGGGLGGDAEISSFDVAQQSRS